MKARFEIVFSMAAFGTIAVFVRNIGLPSGEVALYRAVIAALALFLWQLCTRQMAGCEKRAAPAVCIRGSHERELDPVV